MAHEARYCTVCLAYAKEKENNAFTEGMKDWKHVHQRIKEHENSKQHNSCAEAHMLSMSQKDMEHLPFSEQQVKYIQVKTNRQVMERVIDVVKLIGKRGLRYCGSKTVAAYSLDDSSLDHGNFLELVKLLGKYDPVL